MLFLIKLACTNSNLRLSLDQRISVELYVLVITEVNNHNHCSPSQIYDKLEISLRCLEL